MSSATGSRAVSTAHHAASARVLKGSLTCVVLVAVVGHLAHPLVDRPALCQCRASPAARRGSPSAILTSQTPRTSPRTETAAS
eukprot:2074148-Rhodomonas_salina.4